MFYLLIAWIGNGNIALAIYGKPIICCHCSSRADTTAKEMQFWSADWHHL